MWKKLRHEEREKAVATEERRTGEGKKAKRPKGRSREGVKKRAKEKRRKCVDEKRKERVERNRVGRREREEQMRKKESKKALEELEEDGEKREYNEEKKKTEREKAERRKDRKKRKREEGVEEERKKTEQGIRGNDRKEDEEKKEEQGEQCIKGNSRVKRALFTSLVAAKSRNLGATYVVAKSRFSVAKIPTATNKVIQLILWIIDSGCSKHMTGILQWLRSFVEKWEHSASRMITSQQSLDMEIMFKAISRYAMYTTLKASDTICFRFSISTVKKRPDNLFVPLYEEYYAMRTLEVSDNSAANTLPNEDTPSSSPIVVEEDKAPQIVTSSEEPIANEATTPVSNDNANELVPEGIVTFNEKEFYNPFYSLVLEEAESSLTF
ncbi:hypothetical protein Tco_0316456 [Tanacetum coccineum]